MRNFLIIAVVTLGQNAGAGTPSSGSVAEHLTTSLSLSLQQTRAETATSLPAIVETHRDWRMTSTREYERLNPWEEDRARSQYANYYLQVWVKNFSRNLVAETKAARVVEQARHYIRAQSVVLVEPTAAERALILTYGYDLFEDRGRVHLEGDSWFAGLEISHFIAGRGLDQIAARGYLQATLNDMGLRTNAHCESTQKVCAFSLQQPITEHIVATVESVSKFDDSRPRMERTGVYVVYQGPVPFLSL